MSGQFEIELFPIPHPTKQIGPLIPAQATFTVSEDLDQIVLNFFGPAPAENGTILEYKSGWSPNGGIPPVDLPRFYQFRVTDIVLGSEQVLVSITVILSGPNYQVRAAQIEVRGVEPYLNVWQSSDWLPENEEDGTTITSPTPFVIPNHKTEKFTLNLESTSGQEPVVAEFKVLDFSPLPFRYALITKWNGASVGKYGYRLNVLKGQSLGLDWYFSSALAIFPGPILPVFDATLTQTVGPVQTNSAQVRFGAHDVNLELIVYQTPDFKSQ